MKEIIIHMGTFDFTVICIVGSDHKKVIKYLRWKLQDDSIMDDLSEARGRCYHKKGWVPVIWIPSKPKTPREYSTIAHEALHATFHMMRWAQIGINEETEEVVTHAQAFIITSILDKLKERR